MIDSQILRQHLLKNAQDVFTLMLNTGIEEVRDHAADPRRGDSERIVSLIGFGGSLSGNCMLSCHPALACLIASGMLMEPYEQVTPEVKDAFGEVSNMVFGNIKTDLEDIVGPLQLGLPTIILGNHFHLREMPNAASTILKLGISGHVLEMRISVSVSEKRAPATERFSTAQIQNDFASPVIR